MDDVTYADGLFYRIDDDDDDDPPPLPSQLIVFNLSVDNKVWPPSFGATNNFTQYILPTFALVIFTLIVIVGNSIVIMAVSTHRKLRRATTNKFIVSLAVADLMVGVIVLPFSSANQVMRRWPFGASWCRVWLAVDVWLCTASILNLCAISVDRYIAISRPFRYATLMSPMRARLLILVVWFLAFVICCPPLITWRGGQQGTTALHAGDWNDAVERLVVFSGNGKNNSSCGTEYLVDGHVSCSNESLVEYEGQGDVDENGGIKVCSLISDPGYIVYSACGSFWVPMLVMDVFYWKIYKTAVSATDAFRRGFIECPPAPPGGSAPAGPTPPGGGSVNGGRGPFAAVTTSRSENAIALRIHRGSRNASTGKFLRHSNGCISELVPLTVAVARTRRSLDERLRESAPDVIAAAGTSHDVAEKMAAAAQTAGRTRQLPTIIITSTTSTTEEWKEGATATTTMTTTTSMTGSASEQDEVKSKKASAPNDSACCGTNNATTSTSTSPSASPSPVRNGSVRKGSGLSDSGDELTADKQRSSLISLKLGKIHIIAQLRSLNKEKRAAKTVGVIIGCFFFCWAPFFTVYLVGAFCRGCTPTHLFHVFFWLGYANSAVNPFIYALCSKEFRYAFKKLLRCRVEQRPRRRPQQDGGGAGGAGQPGSARAGPQRFLGRLESFRLQIASRHEESLDDDVIGRMPPQPLAQMRNV